VSLLLSGRFALWQRVSCNSHVFDTRLAEAQGQQKFLSLLGVGDMWSVLQAVASQKELFILLRGLCSISGLYLSDVNQLKSYPYSLSFGRYVINSKIVIVQTFDKGRCEPLSAYNTELL